MEQIRRLGDPVLRAVAKPLEAAPEAGALRDLVHLLTESMRQADGVGIAAPQIGISVRVFLIEVDANNPRYPGQEPFPLQVFANPTVTLNGPPTRTSLEGCLSIPGLRGLAARHAAVTVTAADISGEVRTLRLEGFPAIVCQHEHDHLNGLLYVDRLISSRALAFQEEAEKHNSLTPRYIGDLIKSSADVRDG